MNLEQRLERIDKKLNSLFQRQQKETWVNGKVIQVVTGWDAKILRLMRDQGVVKIEGTGRTAKYLLESIPEQFIKAKS